MPLGMVNRLAKLKPNHQCKSISLREAVDSEPRLQQIAEQEPIAQRLFEITEKIEGLYRHASTHPAGVVIGDRPLDEILPLYRDPRSEMPVTQFDYEVAEKAGLVKFDFLGLKTLTVIAKAEELLKKRGIELHTQTIDFDDISTFEMLSHGDSVGVFQMEGAGMRDLLRKMKPNHINDLVALVALYRPGPMDSIPTYIARKNGKEVVEYLHPALEPILKETYGVMTYQDDVMRIARELAASMTLDIGNTDRLNIFRQEAQRLGVKVAPPDINVSEAVFTCDAGANTVFYALAAGKGVGRQAMDHVVEVRKEGGRFKSLSDFARRIDPRLVNKRAFENLVRAGTFDSLNPNRRQVVENSDRILGGAQAAQRERESGQASMFGGDNGPSEEIRLTSIPDWPVHERLGEEFSAMGCYLSGHPL